MNNKGFSEEIKRKCIPIFSRNKNVTIIKKENGFILSSPKTLSTIRMNNLTYEILMLCNGKNNLLSISNTIRNKYDVSEEKIDQDIANLLYPLWKSFIIHILPSSYYKVVVFRVPLQGLYITLLKI